jgi:hypothetical protein
MIRTAALSALAIGAFAASLPSQAGDWGKAPVKQSSYVVDDCVDVGGSISAGYMTDYLFHGVRFARDSVWTDVNYTYDGLAIPVQVGAYYLNGISGSFLGASFDELRLYARSELGTFLGFDTSLGYTHYIFPEFRTSIAPLGGYGELDLGLRRDLAGLFDLVFGTHFAFGGGTFEPRGWYHRLGLERSYQFTEMVGFQWEMGVAYSDGYWGVSNWNHYYLTFSLPITLNCRATLTPYIGYVGAPTGWAVDGIIGGDKPQSDVLHGGVSLSVSF